MIKRVVVVGGGSAGFLAAITLKARLPQLAVTLIRSHEIGIIGVGEGSTAILPAHLHGYLGIDHREFYQQADPLWKLGIRFIWGSRPFFDYSFAEQFDVQHPTLPRPSGFYCAEGSLEFAGVGSGLMSMNKAFVRQQDGRPLFTQQIGYHLENEKFVRFLETYAARLGIKTIDDTIVDVTQNEVGVSGLRLAGGATHDADLYIDCSGFFSLLLSKTLQEPYISFKSSLFCDRAVVGGWTRGEEPIKPYTTAETMDAGWCWQIEHEHRINRGYVYSSSFISDADAEAEFRRKNPKLTNTRIVKFSSGRYERTWVKNVVAIGNASGFVEPLESTSLGLVCTESLWLAASLAEANCRPEQHLTKIFNKRVARGWDIIRYFLSLHYKFNTRLDTPFWRECREKTDLSGAADFVDFYQENGPSLLWRRTLIDQDDQFGMEGYLAMMVGQQVPYRPLHKLTFAELTNWDRIRNNHRAIAGRAFSVTEALQLVRSPEWVWPKIWPTALRGMPTASATGA